MQFAVHAFRDNYTRVSEHVRKTSNNCARSNRDYEMALYFIVIYKKNKKILIPKPLLPEESTIKQTLH